MAQHIYTGPLRTRSPEFFGAGPGVYHVANYHTQTKPIGVSACEATLLAGGGDLIDPGSSIDMAGEGVWIAPPMVGGMPVVSIELRGGPSYRSVDPLRQQTAIASAKCARFVLDAGMWRPFLSTVIGLQEFYLRCDGGGTGATVWIGSHIATTWPSGHPKQGQPKTLAEVQDDADSGHCWPLKKTDPPLFIRGNQTMHAYAEVGGLVLYMLKMTNGYDIVKRPA